MNYFAFFNKNYVTFAPLCFSSSSGTSKNVEPSEFKNKIKSVTTIGWQPTFPTYIIEDPLSIIPTKSFYSSVINIAIFYKGDAPCH